MYTHVKLAQVERAIELAQARGLHSDTDPEQLASFIAGVQFGMDLDRSDTWSPAWVDELIAEAEKQEETERLEENAEWSKRYDEINNAWDEWLRNRGEFKYCTPSVDNLPTDLAHDGYCVVFDTDEDGRVMYSDCMKCPTWGDIAEAFDQIIPRTGDFHHSFLEGMGEVGRDAWKPGAVAFCSMFPCEIDEITLFKFHTGS